METIIVILFIGVMVFLSFIKTKLSDKWQLIVACIAGLVLLIWFWGFEIGETRWKILITVVVVGSIYNLVRKIGSSIHKTRSAITS